MISVTRTSHERETEMKTLNRVMGAVKVVGGLGMLTCVLTASGPLVWLAPLCGIGAGLMLAAGVRGVATGK